MKRLSVVSEVVLVLQGYEKRDRFTSDDIKRELGTDNPAVSSALTHLYRQGYLKFTGKEGRLYQWKIERSLRKYPTRNAPAYSPRKKKSGYTVTRLDGGRPNSGPRIQKSLQGIRASIARMLAESERLALKCERLEKKLEKLS